MSLIQLYETADKIETLTLQNNLKQLYNNLDNLIIPNIQEKLKQLYTTSNTLEILTFQDRLNLLDNAEFNVKEYERAANASANQEHNIMKNNIDSLTEILENTRLLVENSFETNFNYELNFLSNYVESDNLIFCNKNNGAKADLSVKAGKEGIKIDTLYFYNEGIECFNKKVDVELKARKSHTIENLVLNPVLDEGNVWLEIKCAKNVNNFDYDNIILRTKDYYFKKSNIKARKVWEVTKKIGNLVIKNKDKMLKI